MATSETTTTAPAALRAGTMCEALLTTMAERGDAVALRTRGDATSYTYAQARERVQAIAATLHGLGVGHGDAVGLMLTNRPEFNLVDAAAMLLGAVPFSVYNTSPPEQIGFVMGDAGNRVVVCEERFRPTVEAARGHGASRVEHVLDVVDLAATEPAAAFDLERLARAVEPSDLLTLIYTSGTTGPPKGVQVTHANMLAELRGVHDALPQAPAGRCCSYLPSAHIADRWASHYGGFMSYGHTVTCVPELPDLMPTVLEVRPTYFGGVPRIWEKMRAALDAKAPGLEEQARADPAVGAAVREQLGLDRSTLFVTGAAPTPVEQIEYFAALGIEICEVWGMSETTCIATTVRPGAARPGSVGTPIEGVEVRIADDGELLVRGGTIMAGYRNRPDLTQEAIDPDGWLHTGDVARIDEDGFVWIVDRKKELIINAAGKNMSPANIESTLKSAGPLIGQAMVVGDRRPYNVALIVLDPESGRDPADPGTIAAVQAEVDAANARLSRVEQVKRFVVLEDEWLAGGDELTPTMKLKRRPIAEKYAARIDELYGA